MSDGNKEHILQMTKRFTSYKFRLFSKIYKLQV